MRPGKVFIDANVLNFAAVYQNSNVWNWLNELYETVYIHVSVLNELLIKQVQDKVQEMIDDHTWILFDPDDPGCISDEQFVIYERFKDLIKQGFVRLSIKKKQEGREVKHTSNIGEIDSLAAAMFLSANFICSNDYEIRELIQDENLCVSLSEEQPPQLIIQDTIEDLCVLIVEAGISSKKEVRKFFKVVYSQDPESKREYKLALLNVRLDAVVI